MANLSNINNKFLVTTGGNVLIGGTAVVGTAKLQVTGEARVYTGSNLGYWGVDAGNSYVYLGTNSSAYGLSLQTGGIDRVNINSAGNATFTEAVGVGVSAGSNAKLEVVSTSGEVFRADSSGGAFRLVVDQTGVNTQGVLTHTGSATFTGTVTAGNGSQAVNSDAMLTLRASAFSGLDIKSARTSGNIGGIRFYDTASNTVPEAQLNVEVDGSYNFYNGTNGAQLRLKIDSSGNVGIGTISPSAKLEVRGTAPTYTNSSTVFWGGTTNNDSHNGIMLSSYGDALGGSLASNLLYSNSGTPTQTNGGRSSGQIKFGNTTVATKTSDINFGGYYKGTTTFVERMKIKSDGQVNISQKPNSGLEYDLLINLGTSPDGLVGYQTREQFNNATLQKWYNVDAANSGSSQWVRLGTLSNFAQGGYTFCLTFYGHTGYNASNSQDFNCKLFMKTSNGAGTGPRFNSWVENTGKNLASPAFKWINTNASGTPTVGGTSYELYMNVPAYCNGSIYAINKHSGDWTSQNAIGQSDPGANSTTVLQAQNVFNILNTNVGIGKTSPGYKLDVSGNIKSSTVTVYDGMGGTETGIGASGAGGNLRLYAGGTNRVTVATSAVTLGVYGQDTIGSNYIQFYNSAGTNQGYIGMGSGASNDFIINCESANVPIRIFNGGSEKMRINSTGTIFMYGLGGYTSSNADVRYATSSKELYYQTSSKRYKTNIVNLENSLDKIDSLRPVRYVDINTEEPACGLIAEETVEIIPEVVFTKEIEGFDKPQVEGINYSDLVPFLIKSIQELKAEIELLKSK